MEQLHRRGQVAGLLRLLAAAVPELVNGLMPPWRVLGTPWEATVLERLYGDLPSADLSRDVLAAQPQALSVLPMAGVSWDDLGDPVRALAVRKGLSRDAQVVETRCHG